MTARILIAEDDPLIASFMEKGLRGEGFTTLLVEDGEQAEQMGTAQEFDLIILDVGLPKADGLEVLRTLWSAGADLPVLVVTGQREVDAAKCLAAGANDYLRKPFHFDQLLSHVHKLLGNANATTG